jgi:hypothetical protein
MKVFYEHVNERSGSIKVIELIVRLKGCKFSGRTLLHGVT